MQNKKTKQSKSHSNQVVFSIDIGATIGYVYHVPGSVGIKDSFKFTTFNQFNNQILEIFWTANMAGMPLPEVIIAPNPVRFYQTILKHGKMLGILECIAEQVGAKLISTNDKKCKLAVMGTGKATKEQVMAWFGENNEHVADARLFLEYYLMTEEPR